MKIRHIYNLRNSLFLAGFLPLTLYIIIAGFLYKEILFLSLENILRDMFPSFPVIFTGAMIIFFIYNEIMLKPLFMRCRSMIHNYRLKYEAIDALCRDILWCIIINLIFWGALCLWYPSEVLRLGWRIFIEFKTAFFTLFICEGIILLVQTLFLYLLGTGADHIEKDTFENWLETDFPSFPIKSGIILFVLYSIFISFWATYISVFINPNLESPMFIILISAVSIILVVSLLYYYLIKRIIGRFLERHELI